MRIVVREIKGQIIRLESVVPTAAKFGVHNRFVALEIRPAPPPPGALRGERKKACACVVISALAKTF